MRRKLSYLTSILVFLAAGCLSGVNAAQTSRQIQVGVYTRPPLQQVYGEGQPQGFAIEILETIAEAENWQLNYTTCQINRCLILLEQGELDLVSAVPEPELENRPAELNREYLIQNWGQVFINPDAGIREISDLEAQTIALMRGDPFTSAFWDRLNQEGVRGNQILVDNYDQVMASIIEDDIPAGVVDHLYALKHADNYQVSATSIIFYPVEIGYALPQGDPAGLGPALDTHLLELKADPDSGYYQALDRWFQDQPDTFVPEWLLWTLTGTAGAAALLLAALWVMQRTIQARTRSLRESEEKYRRFFQTSKDSVFITTVDGRWVDVNRATLQLFGYQDRELLLNTPVETLYKNRQDREDHIKRIRDQGFVKEYPLDMVRKDGTTLHTLITTAAIRDEQGAVVGFQGTIRDITERLMTEEKLETSRERLDLAIKGTNVGLWDWEVKTGEIVIDERWAEIVGYTLVELRPTTIKTWENLTHPQDLDKSYEIISAHFAGDQEQYSCEVRMKHKEGHWVWVLDRGRVVEWDQDGSPVRMAGTHLDITERKQAEQEVQEYIQKVENMQRITSALSSTLSLDDVLHLIMEKISATIPYSSASIFLIEDQALKVYISRGLPEDMTGKTFPVKSPLFQEIEKTRRAVIIDDASKDPRFGGWGGTGDVRGWMGVPLLIKEQLIGYITFDSYQPHTYGFAEAELAEPFAAQAAQAIENARLYEQVQQYARDLEKRVHDRTAELQEIVNLMAGREVRMIELKETIQTLRDQLLKEGIQPAADDPLVGEQLSTRDR